MEQNYFGQPNNGYEGVNVTLPPQKQRKTGLAIATLVLGILSILGLCCCLNIVTAPLAIIFGIIVLCKRFDGIGLAITGIVFSVLSLLVVVGAIVSVREILPYAEEIGTDYLRMIEEQDEVFPAYEENGTLPEYLEKYTDSPYTEMLEKYDITFYDVMDAFLEQYKAGALEIDVEGMSELEMDEDTAEELNVDTAILLPA